MERPEQNAPLHSDPFVIINGGVEIEVTKVDGTREKTKVRQLPLRLIPDWAGLLTNEPKLLELYTAKEEAWADSVIVEDQERIIEIGGQLNYPTFDRWIARLEATTGRALRTAEARTGTVETIKARVQALGTPASISPSPSA